MTAKPLVAITGASSGIGEAVAKAFSAAGHPVLLMARRLDRMEALNLPINTKGVMNTVHAVMSGMMKRRAGTLFMMSSIAGRKVYPDHTVYCGTKFFVHAVAESLREHLADYDVRVIVLSPGIIETEVLSGVKDANTLKAYQDNKVKIGGGIGPEHVANIMLHSYQMPQNALIQEICITPTRQKF
jgi:NADP-dependent 3-hydroxy acid dehydrogenase YdfG